MTIRLATANDAEPIRAIYNSYVTHSTCTYQIELETAEERAAWFRVRGPRVALHPELTSAAPTGLKNRRPEPQWFWSSVLSLTLAPTLLPNHLRAGGFRGGAHHRVRVAARSLDVTQEVRAEVPEVAQVRNARGPHLAARVHLRGLE